MTNQLQQKLKSIEAEFEEKFCVETDDEGLVVGAFDTQGDCLCYKYDTQIKQFLHTSNLEIIKMVIEMAREMNNFRQAKVDGHDDWNYALAQSARKVEAFITSLEESIKE